MPRKRKWQEIVKPFDPLKENHPYLVRITRICKDPNVKAMCVTLEHIGDDIQAGRIHQISLPLPIRPEGLTANFFRATGIQLEVGYKITPTVVIGKTTYARFSQSKENEEAHILSFESITHEAESTQQDAQRAKSSEQSATDV